MQSHDGIKPLFFKIVNIERLVELFDAKSVEAIEKKIVIPSSRRQDWLISIKDPKESFVLYQQMWQVKTIG